MRRLVYLSSAATQSVGGFAPASPEKLLHLRKVLRLEWDEEIRVSDGNGRIFDGTFVRRGETAGALLDTLRSTTPKPIPLELMIGLPKNQTMDWIVEKAVECGATRIVPISTTRSVVRAKADELEKYLVRWKKIAEGAVEQSEQPWAMMVEGILPLTQALPSSPETASLIFTTEPRLDATEEPAALRELSKRFGGSKPIRLFVGPEGGFTDVEVEQARQKGFVPASLGASVLRVETAVIAALTLARFCRVTGNSGSVK